MSMVETLRSAPTHLVATQKSMVTSVSWARRRADATVTLNAHARLELLVWYTLMV